MWCGYQRLVLLAPPKQGSLQERLFSLMTFGIPVKLMPIQEDGSIDLEHHTIWLEQRRKIEANQKSENHQVSGSILPGPMDILFGRDKIAQSHPGNARFLHVISTLQEHYDSAATKEERFVVAAGIVLRIKESGRRFLKFDDSNWTVVDDKAARYKVTNAFRSNRKKQNIAASKADLTASSSLLLKRKAG